MSFGDFKERCIKKGLKRIGLDELNKGMAGYKEEDAPGLSVAIQEIKFPPQVILFIFQKDPGWFGQVVIDGNKIGVLFSSPPEPYKKILDC